MEVGLGRCRRVGSGRWRIGGWRVGGAGLRGVEVGLRRVEVGGRGGIGDRLRKGVGRGFPLWGKSAGGACWKMVDMDLALRFDKRSRLGTTFRAKFCCPPTKQSFTFAELSNGSIHLSLGR